MREVLRQEQKYLCTLDQYYRLKHELSQVLQADPHNGEEGYIVRSLYFDTLFDSDFYNKVDGVEIRKKMRLRIYHSGDQYAYLEMKQKSGAYQKKRSLKVTKEDALELCQGHYSVLLNYSEEFAMECYSVLNEELYFPKVIIEYHRLAFVLTENNTRITFDRNVKATSSSFDLFDKELNMDECIDQYGVILEVKFNHFLIQYIKDMIKLQNPTVLSISKYYYSRQQIVI